ncbi:MAG TPA: carboxypeptidase-like regulatory domain-containing protein [Nitrososphaera sp.]|nr:carboxypeptidase-like regulatory domain-containing protein [Nitrososphaera sp.]
MKLIILTICLSWIAYLSTTLVMQKQNQPSAGIKGQVYDNHFGLPVSGARITALAEGRDQQYTLSDQEGNYEIKQLSEGKYTVSVECLGFAHTERIVQVRMGQEVLLDIPLRAGYLSDPIPTEINGTVKLSNNTPVKNVTIIVVSPFDQQIAGKTRTNQVGQYTVPVNDPGQYVIYAFKPGFKVATTPIILRPTIPRQKYMADLVLTSFN